MDGKTKIMNVKPQMSKMERKNVGSRLPEDQERSKLKENNEGKGQQLNKSKSGRASALDKVTKADSKNSL